MKTILIFLPYLLMAAIGYFLGIKIAKLLICPTKNNTVFKFLLIIFALFGCIYLAFYLEVVTTAFWACGLIPFMGGLLQKVIGHNEKTA